MGMDGVRDFDHPPDYRVRDVSAFLFGADYSTHVFGAVFGEAFPRLVELNG